MKLGSLLLQLNGVEYKIAVYDEILSYLGREDLEIPTSLEAGIVPEEYIVAVKRELLEKKAALQAVLEAVEEVEIEDVDLEALGGG